MEKLHFSIIINASNKKVWETMLGNETYKIWGNDLNRSARNRSDAQ